jgi:hypothetical protein
MKKQLLIAATAIALALPAAGFSRIAFADPTEHDHDRLSAEDRAAFTDAKIAGLKAGLKLTPAQEKNWPAVETALREIGKTHAERFEEAKKKFKDDGRHDVIEGLRFRSKMLAARSADMAKLAEAAKPLYDSLDDAQKRRLGLLLHAIRHHYHHHHWWRHGSSEHETGEDQH